MNNRGQGGLFTLLFFDLVFFILWGMGLAGILNYWGAVGAAQTSGLEAFLFSSLNLIVLVGVVLANLAFFSLGGGNNG